MSIPNLVEYLVLQRLQYQRCLPPEGSPQKGFSHVTSMADAHLPPKPWHT